MASGGSEPEEDDLDRLLECPICYEVMSEPKFMNCGHTMCSGCTGQIQGGRNIECPVCREKTPVSRNGLPTVYALQAIIELLSKKKDQLGGGHCVRCDGKCKAKDIIYCHQCMTTMCKETEERCNPNYEYEHLSLRERMQRKNGIKLDLFESIENNAEKRNQLDDNDDSPCCSTKSGTTSPSISESPTFASLDGPGPSHISEPVIDVIDIDTPVMEKPQKRNKRKAKSSKSDKKETAKNKKARMSDAEVIDLRDWQFG